MISKRSFKFSISKKVSILLMLMLLTLVLLALTRAAQAAPQATFLIETNVAEVNSDGDCSLHEAFANIEFSFTIYPDCPSGAGGSHTINLDGRTITISTPLYGVNGYRMLSPSAGNITIEGNGGTIQLFGQACDAGNVDISEFRLFTLASNRSLTINDTTLTGGCLLGANGGAFLVSNGMLTLNDSTLVDNTGVRGGAIYTSGGTVRISNSTLTDNTASDDGGAIFNASASSMIIVSSTLNGNSASDNGGALMTNHTNSDVTLVNTTLHGNTAGRWGGGTIIGSSGGTVTLYNTTITHNTGTAQGGGIYRNSGTYTIHNSIISGNISNGNDECGGSYTTSEAINSVLGYSSADGGCTGFSTSTNNITPAHSLPGIFDVDGSNLPRLTPSVTS